MWEGWIKCSTVCCVFCSCSLCEITLWNRELIVLICINLCNRDILRLVSQLYSYFMPCVVCFQWQATPTISIRRFCCWLWWRMWPFINWVAIKEGLQLPDTQRNYAGYAMLIWSVENPRFICTLVMFQIEPNCTSVQSARISGVFDICHLGGISKVIP